MVVRSRGCRARDRVASTAHSWGAGLPPTKPWTQLATVGVSSHDRIDCIELRESRFPIRRIRRR